MPQMSAQQRNFLTKQMFDVGFFYIRTDMVLITGKIMGLSVKMVALKSNFLHMPFEFTGAHFSR